MVIHIHGKDELVVQFRVQAPSLLLRTICRENNPLFTSSSFFLLYKHKNKAFNFD